MSFGDGTMRFACIVPSLGHCDRVPTVLTMPTFSEPLGYPVVFAQTVAAWAFFIASAVRRAGIKLGCVLPRFAGEAPSHSQGLSCIESF